MYCAGKTSACWKRRFALSVLHSCNVKTQICVTRPQCVDKIQRDATVCRCLLLQNYSTCFGCLSHPSSGVHQTVTAAPGTGHIVRATTFRQCGPIRAAVLINPRWRKVVALTLWPVPEAAVTVWCRVCLKCDGTRAETRFSLSAKRTSPFKSVWASVQSTTGSPGVRISGINAGYTMFRGSVKSTGYLLHSPVSPSLPLPASPCAITFQLDSTPDDGCDRNPKHVE